MPPSFFKPPTERPRDPLDENPWATSTYLQYIHGLDGEMREMCLRWVQVCRFARQLPAEWEFFAGRFASLGLDRLGLANSSVLKLLEAVAGSGVRIPETGWKLRVARPWCALIEPSEDVEPVLPTHWLEGVELHGKPDSLWIGRRALEQPLCPAPFDKVDEAALGASKRIEEVDWSAYQPQRYGWKSRDVSHWPNFMEAYS
ncbi:hypothetical protein [Lacipirellula parvula]|uniref:Uncharacterized protein n=1 Tax=Lacipirellula parvula TaxID=2650471 RepID=A0A5K7X9J8_9BACT|nr:hypothetical protein [Lacipirellula parvula]BBO31103.1 hypothetical protein PLANPX_0715 [Lacipirellula parvula]